LQPLGIALYHGLESLQQLTRLAKLAEDKEFNSIWATERYFHEEVYSVLGALAASTNRIKLGIGVTNPYTRTVVGLAMASATVDQLSKGRLILGLGRASRDLVESLGLSYDKPLNHLRTYISQLRSLLAGEALKLGKTPLRLDILPSQREVPIWLAATGLRALTLAASIADGVLLNAYSTPEYVRYAVEKIKSSTPAGKKEPVIAVMLVCRFKGRMNDKIDQIIGRLVRLLSEPNVGEVLLEKSGYDARILSGLRRAHKLGRREEAKKLIPKELVREACVFTIEDAASRLKELRAAGAGIPILIPRLEDFEAAAKNLGG
jgi:5,10-methylenetetrahydromethanopterin reductase